MALYSETVMDHFRNPRNVGVIEDADGVGEVGNALCGDIMKIYLKIEDGIIIDVKFETFGCGSAIATSSMATELIKGKKVEEALTLTNQAVVEALVNAELIRTPGDLYFLKVAEVAELERMGKKSAENLIAAIDKSKGQDLSRLLYAFGIRQVGSKAGKILAARFGSLDALMAATQEELTAVDDVGRSPPALCRMARKAPSPST